MAINQKISTPAIHVNNRLVQIVPNSGSFKSGRGEKKVEAASGGGDTVTTVVSVDASTKISMVKFQLHPTADNQKLVEEWQALTTGVAIRLSSEDFAKPFNSMIMVNDPEVGLSADGMIDVEFQGEPAG